MMANGSILKTSMYTQHSVNKKNFQILIKKKTLLHISHTRAILTFIHHSVQNSGLTTVNGTTQMTSMSIRVSLKVNILYGILKTVSGKIQMDPKLLDLDLHGSIQMESENKIMRMINQHKEL